MLKKHTFFICKNAYSECNIGDDCVGCYWHDAVDTMKETLNVEYDHPTTKEGCPIVHKINK